MMTQHIIQKPYITEHTLDLAAKGWYTFVVDVNANKPEIAREIMKNYKVKVLVVRSVTMPGKERRVGRKMLKVVKPGWKKALVSLAKGQTIDAFHVETQGEKGK